MQHNWLMIIICCALPPLAPAANLPSAVAHWQQAPRERVFEGTVEAVNKATVAAQTHGRIARLPYDVNDFVPKGAVIVQFTDREQRDAVQKARALLAEARARAAESALAEAKKQLDYTVVKAPYAGIVTARQVEVGETVAPGQALMTGLSLDRLRVRVDLPKTVVDAASSCATPFCWSISFSWKSDAALRWNRPCAVRRAHAPDRS